jgi:hypothetical protein
MVLEKGMEMVVMGRNTLWPTPIKTYFPPADFSSPDPEAVVAT